jgi:ATP-binding cassette subfamily B protein RaxB
LLARALYRQPKILFLDEATSHLDVQLESVVNQAVRSLNITRIIIAHRPETIRAADRILVLAGGQLQELPKQVNTATQTPAVVVA